MALHLHLLQFYTYTYIYLYLYRLLLTTTSILLLSLRLFHADPTEYFLPTTPYRLLPTYLQYSIPTASYSLLLTDHSLPTTHFQITSNQQLSGTISLLLHPSYPSSWCLLKTDVVYKSCGDLVFTYMVVLILKIFEKYCYRLYPIKFMSKKMMFYTSFLLIWSSLIW